MAVSKALLAAGSERGGGLNHILDLSAVDLPLTQVSKLVAGEPAVWHITAYLLEECDPNPAARLGGEVVVAERDMDSRLERLVEHAHPVRR